MGLNQTHLRSLGDDLTNQDKVTQIYTMNDWLYPILTITPLTLVGKHYQIPGSEKDGHFFCMRALNRYFNGLPIPRDVPTEAQAGQSAGLYGSVGYHYAT
jgi:hypothetical protein